jgi:hypothetical protein
MFRYRIIMASPISLTYHQHARHRLENGLVCIFAGALRIQATPVAADDLGLWMVPEPAGGAVGCAILHDVQHLMLLEINDNRAIAAISLALGPIIDPHHAGFPVTFRPGRALLQVP